MNRINFFIKSYYPYIIIILILSTFYSLSIAPGLTWANNGADGGDLITAAYTWGVAHPPGYPFYLTIARLFQWLPIGSIAFRTNLLSVICTLLSSIFLYKLTLRYINSENHPEFIAIITSLSFGLSKFVWSQAVITEIYSLQLLLLIIFLFLLPAENRQNSLKKDFFLGIIFGLALQNHLTSLFLLPFVFTLGIVKYPIYLKFNKNKGEKKITLGYINWKALFIRLGGILLALLFSLTIFLRTYSGSPVIWGNPKNIQSYFWLISGKYYSGSLVNISFDFVLSKIHLWGQFLGKQIGLFGLVVSAIGFIFIGSKSFANTIQTFWIFISFFVFSLFYNSIDSYIYLVFSMIVICLWFGWGISFLYNSFIKNWKIPPTMFFLIILLAQLVYGMRIFSEVDASKDTRAEKFGEKIIQEAPKNSIVFTDADKDSFSLWYFQYVLKKRLDMTIVVTNLLDQEWYRNELMAIYPAINIPSRSEGSWKSTVIYSNSDHPICQTLVIDDYYFSCE